MSINRRDFLKFSGATTAGVFFGGLSFLSACSPKPSKLRNCKYVKLVCPGCGAGCGLVASTRNNKIINIEGDFDHPLNQGAICPKGSAYIDYFNQSKNINALVKTPNSKMWAHVDYENLLKDLAHNIQKTHSQSFITKKSNVVVNRTEKIAVFADSSLTNEEFYLWQKFSRLLGITDLTMLYDTPPLNDLPDGLDEVSTNQMQDLGNSDLIFLWGANPASTEVNLCRYLVQAKEERRAKIINVDPCYTESSILADLNITVKPGSDLVLANGIINYLLCNKIYNKDYIKEYTNAKFLIKEEFNFELLKNPGLLFNKESTEKNKYFYILDRKGSPAVDNFMLRDNCVFQILKKYVEKYDFEYVEAYTGVSQKEFLKMVNFLIKTAKSNLSAAFVIGGGICQQQQGTQVIHSLRIIQLLLGNIGVLGGGLFFTKSSVNLQGGMDFGFYKNSLPGYLALPKEDKTFPQMKLNDHLQRYPVSNNHLSANLRRNRKIQFVSLLKAWFGPKAIERTDYCFSFLPKIEVPKTYSDILQKMQTGGYEGAFVLGADLLANSVNFGFEAQALSKLKWLAVIGADFNQTANFWNHPLIKKINVKTKIYFFPVAGVGEVLGSYTSDSRLIQKTNKIKNQKKYNYLIVADKLFKILKKNIAFSGEESGKILLKANWNYNSLNYQIFVEQVAREFSGYKINGNSPLKEIDDLNSNGLTACGNYLYCGLYSSEGNLAARQEIKKSKYVKNLVPGWGWSWPGNTRILYNRAGLGRNSLALKKGKSAVFYDNGLWDGDLVHGQRRFGPQQKNPFQYMFAGVGCLFDPFAATSALPEPLAVKEFSSIRKDNLLQKNKYVYSSPEKFPLVCLLVNSIGNEYNLNRLPKSYLDEFFPESCCEIGVKLARKLAVQTGDWVRISTVRGGVDVKCFISEKIVSFGNLNCVVLKLRSDLANLQYQSGWSAYFKKRQVGYLQPKESNILVKIEKINRG